MKYATILTAILLTNLATAANVKTGLDNATNHPELFKNKRIGIIANHTALDSQGRFITEVLRSIEGVEITALFGPEHGFQGHAPEGEKIADNPDAEIPIFSLYGQHRKPTAQMLENVDLLVFDIQDIGARYYTYISTMAFAMDSAALHDKPFVVLDRPNPINAATVQGPVLDPNFATFVGLYPIPVRHGMTAGELATMINNQNWLESGRPANLTVIKMDNYDRHLWLDQTGLQFIKPSPNMPTLETATIYPGTCLLEGTNLSEGRGADDPFLTFGAPWIHAAALTSALNAHQLPGLQFQPHHFTPTASKYKDHPCHGCRIIITDRDQLDPFHAGLTIIQTIHQLYPNDLEWHTRHFDRLAGTDHIRKQIINNQPLDELKQHWQTQLKEFHPLRTQHLLY